MSQTVAYVRVSTDDQVEFSPEAQAKRCKDLARLRDLGPLQVMADEGWSGKNLERPKMRELLEQVEAGEIAHLVVWRWDRLSRDQEDFAALVKLFDRCGVQVHSVNEGDLDLRTASGRMQIGVHGVFAQFYRDQIVENSRMGMRQAFEMGRWQNRAPTGYDMVTGRLEPNEMAPIVQRIFALRSAGASYPAIAAETGICYSTARHILENRVYLGEVSLSNEWGPGIHQALVTLDEFNASQRGHTKGQRRSSDLLSGVVRCGLCRRVACVRYNERNQALYACRHRGEGCKQPGRAASGLQRAAVLGLRLLATDQDLQDAIREVLNAHRLASAPKGPSAASTLASLTVKHRKLLDLYYADQIDGETFAVENERLTAQINTLREETERVEAERRRLDVEADQFEVVAELLASMDVDQLWSEATEAEKKTLVQDLVDSICIYPDQLTVQVVGAPEIRVKLEEVGLRAGSRPVVSEGRTQQSPTGGSGLGRNDSDPLHVNRAWLWIFCPPLGDGLTSPLRHQGPRIRAGASAREGQNERVGPWTRSQVSWIAATESESIKGATYQVDATAPSEGQ
jgi:site-specific DNA recombinase